MSCVAGINGLRPRERACVSGSESMRHFNARTGNMDSDEVLGSNSRRSRHLVKSAGKAAYSFPSYSSVGEGLSERRRRGAR
jgi:hypothetical protein